MGLCHWRLKGLDGHPLQAMDTMALRSQPFILEHWEIGACRPMAPGLIFHLILGIAGAWGFHRAAAKPDAMWPTMGSQMKSNTHNK